MILFVWIFSLTHLLIWEQNLVKKKKIIILKLCDGYLTNFCKIQVFNQFRKFVDNLSYYFLTNFHASWQSNYKIFSIIYVKISIDMVLLFEIGCFAIHQVSLHQNMKNKSFWFFSLNHWPIQLLVWVNINPIKSNYM